jgi:hypothetical protein
MSPARSREPAACPSPRQTSRPSGRPQAGYPSSAERTRSGPVSHMPWPLYDLPASHCGCSQDEKRSMPQILSASCLSSPAAVLIHSPLLLRLARCHPLLSPFLLPRPESPGDGRERAVRSWGFLRGRRRSRGQKSRPRRRHARLNLVRSSVRCPRDGPYFRPSNSLGEFRKPP